MYVDFSENLWKQKLGTEYNSRIIQRSRGHYALSLLIKINIQTLEIICNLYSFPLMPAKIYM